MSTIEWFEDKFHGLKELAAWLKNHHDPQVQAAGHEVESTVEEIRRAAGAAATEADHDAHTLETSAATDAGALGKQAEADAAKVVDAAHDSATSAPAPTTPAAEKSA